jgi:hypothetical protein
MRNNSTCFHMKLDALLDDIKLGSIFGPINVILYSIEFQKCGLPHVHILVWLNKNGFDITLDIIDQFIAAKIPDPKSDPLGYALIAEHMVYGPYGDKNPNSTCMKKGNCSKYYPKSFQQQTTFDDNGFTLYRRRDTSIIVRRSEQNLDNKWVVPHNLYLIKKYQAHINVEYYNKSRILKYLCKYVNKGLDRAKFIFQEVKRGKDISPDKQTGEINEIQEYLDARYICEQDGLWRLLGFEIHYHTPSVE